MCGPEFGCPQGKGLLMPLQRLTMLAKIRMKKAEAVHALQRVGMVGTQYGGAPPYRVLAQLQSGLALAEGLIAQGQIIRRSSRCCGDPAPIELEPAEGFLVDFSRLLPMASPLLASRHDTQTFECCM